MDLVRGTLDVLVLKTLSWGPMHGYSVTRWLQDRTGADMDVEDGAIYQALYRMERRGLLEAEWGRSENNRKAKFYHLTPRGRSELRRRTTDIRSYVNAMFAVLDAETI